MKKRTCTTASVALAALATLLGTGGPLAAQAAADLEDVEMAHVAVTASEIDIAWAHLALAVSDDPAIRGFAETMIRDHTAVNAKVAELAAKLGIEARDNPLSRTLRSDARVVLDELSGLRGDAFDRRYAENELAYHETVNGVVEDAFIPNVDNPDVRAAFEQALAIFRGHERHARETVRRVAAGSR